MSLPITLRITRGAAPPPEPEPLDAGSISATSGDGIVTISQVTAPSGGTSPYTRNLYRSTSSGSKGSVLASGVTLPYADETVTNDITYYYTQEVVDDVSGSADTAQAVATPRELAFADLTTNLPSGMTAHADNSFSTLTYDDPLSDAFWSWATNRSGEDPTIEDDATAPSGNGKVWRQNYAGVPDGTEPKYPTVNMGNGLEVFISMHVKFAESWTTPFTSGIKWHLLNATQDGSTQTAGWFGIKRESEEQTLEPNLRWQFNGTCVPGGNCGIYPTVGSVRPEYIPDPVSLATMTRGVWHKLQYYMNKNTPGIVRIWLNDVLIVDETGFEWNDPTGGWQAFVMGATWGGSATPNPAPEGAIIYYDRCAIWRR